MNNLIIMFKNDKKTNVLEINANDNNIVYENLSVEYLKLRKEFGESNIFINGCVDIYNTLISNTKKFTFKELFRELKDEGVFNKDLELPENHIKDMLKDYNESFSDFIDKHPIDTISYKEVYKEAKNMLTNIINNYMFKEEKTSNLAKLPFSELEKQILDYSLKYIKGEIKQFRVFDDEIHEQLYQESLNDIKDYIECILLDKILIPKDTIEETFGKSDIYYKICEIVNKNYEHLLEDYIDENVDTDSNIVPCAYCEDAIQDEYYYIEDVDLWNDSYNNIRFCSKKCIKKYILANEILVFE